MLKPPLAIVVLAETFPAVQLTWFMEGQNSLWQRCSANHFLTLQGVRYNLWSNEKCEYFTDYLPSVAFQEFPLYKSVVYTPLGVEVGSLFWELTAGTVSLAVFMLLSVYKQSQTLASWCEMTPDMEWSPKEVSNIKIQQRGSSTAQLSMHTEQRLELVKVSTITIFSFPHALLRDWFEPWLGEELSGGHVKKITKGVFKNI